MINIIAYREYIIVYKFSLDRLLGDLYDCCSREKIISKSNLVRNCFAKQNINTAVEIVEQQKQKQKLARMVSKWGIWFYMVILMIWCRAAVSFSVINSLPGFSGSLPFKLETGYIGVGDVELFYYFIESESNPAEDPLLLWLTGGPGCTSLAGLAFEIGPLRLNIVEYDGSLPTFSLNPYSWTKVASIIFVDAPVGTGFSYSRTLQGFKTGDKQQATDTYNFLTKWLVRHPKYMSNPLYIGGDSYSGMIVPIIVQLIADGIEVQDTSTVPLMNLKGYLVGNPVTDPKFDENSRISFYHCTALISDELYESARRNCKEEYVLVDSSNVMCAKDVEAISECTAHINRAHILKPDCLSDAGLTNRLRVDRKLFLEMHPRMMAHEFHDITCPDYQYDLCTVWANDFSVQKALHIRMGTIKEWIGCNNSLDYDFNVNTCLDYHRYLNTKAYRALVYSGDHDAVVSYVGTMAWIKSLNLSILHSWRPWFVDGQVAGYSTEFQNNFTFATVKGGGHTAPEFNPKECFAMFKTWISHQPL